MQTFRHQHDKVTAEMHRDTSLMKGGGGDRPRPLSVHGSSTASAWSLTAVSGENTWLVTVIQRKDSTTAASAVKTLRVFRLARACARPRTTREQAARRRFTRDYLLACSNAVAAASMASRF